MLYSLCSFIINLFFKISKIDLKLENIFLFYFFSSLKKGKIHSNHSIFQKYINAIHQVRYINQVLTEIYFLKGKQFFSLNFIHLIPNQKVNDFLY